MTSFEAFDDNSFEAMVAWQPSAGLTREELRQRAKIDSDYMLTDLELELAVKGLNNRPRFFRTSLPDDYVGQQRVLVVPLRDSHNSTGVFVGVNVVRSHPRDIDSEILSTTAYKFYPTERFLVQSPVGYSERHKSAKEWPVNDLDFEPFLYYDNGELQMTWWHEDRLEKPVTLPPRLSEEYSARSKKAKKLKQILQSIHEVDEALIPGFEYPNL